MHHPTVVRLVPWVAKGVFSRLLGLGNEQAQPPGPATASQQEPPEQKKKGFFGKIAGIFKDDKQSTPPPKPPDASPH